MIKKMGRKVVFNDVPKIHFLPEESEWRKNNTFKRIKEEKILDPWRKKSPINENPQYWKKSKYSKSKFN